MSPFEKKLFQIYKYARDKYPEYRFGYLVLPHLKELPAGHEQMFVEMSVMFRKANIGGQAVRRVNLPLDQPMPWYAEQWLEMLQELDATFTNKKASETGITEAAENITDEPEESKEPVEPEIKTEAVTEMFPKVSKK